MERVIVQGGTPLRGKVAISGSKNALLPILAATVMCEGKSTIQNVPKIGDGKIMLDLPARISG
jgi:UDP-N-acetylglucosamine 1-carboxyvinyltransferase